MLNYQILCISFFVTNIYSLHLTHNADTLGGLSRIKRSKLVNLPEECGLTLSDDRITNGFNASLGQFPFMALLGYTERISNLNLLQFICGGTIINEYFILTAAHCLDRTLTVARFGELDTTQKIDCVEEAIGIRMCADPHIDMNIEKQIIHEDYNPATYKNDIGLIKVANKIKFTEYIQPICLPLNDNEGIPHLTVSGWGKTNNNNVGTSTILQYAVIELWQKLKCENVIGREYRPLSKTQLCGNGKKGQDACAGDSGGPLFGVKQKDSVVRHHQIGIVSFGAGGCGNAELPSVYTKVDQYIDWIIEKIK